MTHAATRAVERYGQELDLSRICRIVRSGRGKFVAPGRDGCTFYDVPYEEARRVTTVRVLMSADNTHVITLVPPKTVREIVKAKRKRDHDRNAEVRKAFFRGFEDDEEDCVTA